MEKVPRKHPACGRCRQFFDVAEGGLQEPVLLSCGHVMCRQCGEEEKEQVGEAKGVKCFKGCGVALWEGAVRHDEMVREVEGGKWDVGVEACEECEEEKGAWWCATCDTTLCKECFDHVHAPKVMKKHTPVPAADRPLPPELCPHHPTTPVTLYCNTHSTKICQTCSESTTHHAGPEHSIVPLDLAASAAVDGIKAQLIKLNSKREGVINTARTVQYMLGGLGVAQEAAEGTIREEMGKMRKAILEELEAQEGRLLRECGEMREEKEEALKGQNETVMRSLGVVTVTRELCRDLLEANPVLVLDAQPYFASRMGEAFSACAGLVHDPSVTPGVPVTFNTTLPGKLTTQLATYGVLGDPRNQPKITATTQPAAPTPSVALSRKNRTTDRTRRSRSVPWHDHSRIHTAAP